jgi:protein TonB
MFSSSRRTLLRALIVSLLLHAVLLLRVVNPFPPRLAAPAARIDVLVGRAAPRAAPAPSVGTPVATPPTTPPKPLALAKPPAPAGRPAPPQPPLVAKTAIAAGVARLDQPESLDAAATAPESAPAASGAPPAPPANARDAVSADDVREYRVSLGTAAKHFKHYPELARKRGWEGTAEVAIIGSALLPVPRVALAQSSGRRLLDEQALEIMTQAVRATALPEGFKGRDFRELMPVVFRLDDDQ